MAVSLQKGQKVSLKKDLNGGADLGIIRMGLGWNVNPSAGTVDLDASCGLYDDQKRQVDVVWFRQLKSKCGSVKHSGDNLTGDGDGDDEVISVDLNKVPANVHHIVFAVTSFRGQKFDVVDGAFVRIVNDANSKELCKYELTAKTPNTAMVMARLYRHNGEWKFAALGEPADGKTVGDLAAKIQTLF